jgi:predicted ABC-type ATPase
MIPKMIVIAGPPGSGKSSLYPVSSFGVAHFNADDRAAELSGGSYIGISREIRRLVNHEFETFILRTIEKRISFAIETTLRSEVMFDQAHIAKQAGYAIEMRYLALQDFRTHLERVKARADAGGHSASEETLRRIYESSLKNLRRAVQELDTVWIYDNTAIDASHPLVLEAHAGEIRFLADDSPQWLKDALGLS